LERGAAASLGVLSASIGLWDAEARVLRFHSRLPEVIAGVASGIEASHVYGFTLDGEVFEVQQGHMIAGRVFAGQQATFSVDAANDDPLYAAIYRALHIRAVLAAPITAGETPLGVLAVYAPRAPIFGDDDLQLVQLLADQAAVIIESRALIDEAARVRAREEATRLRDDFLSAAAHDLRTPLTTLIAQAQLLERRALRRPDDPVDIDGIRRIVGEGQRLRQLVFELLDAARAEQGRLVGEREAVELVALVQECCARQGTERHPCIVEADGHPIGEYDKTRIMQLVDNLLENAIKYSPDGGVVRVRVWAEDEEAHLAVTDQGIGIPPADLPHVFDRFHRAGNVDDRRFAGMGLGLFISRGIVEQHGGRIEVESAPGQGSTFHVILPINAPVLA
jgi:signal transduction histidine kinase